MAESRVKSKNGNPVDNHLETFRSNLKELRKQNDLTQTELSEHCGFSSTYVGKIERGEKYPSFETLLRLCNVLNVDVVDFFQLDGTPKKVLKNGTINDKTLQLDLDLKSLMNDLDMAELGVGLIDQKGHVQYSNEHFSTAFGYSSEEIQRKPLWEIDLRYHEQTFEEDWDPVFDADQGSRISVFHPQKRENRPVRTTEFQVSFNERDYVLVFITPTDNATNPEPASPLFSGPNLRDKHNCLPWEEFSTRLQQRYQEVQRYGAEMTLSLMHLNALPRQSPSPEGSRRHAPGYKRTLSKLYEHLSDSIRQSDIMSPYVDTQPMILFPHTPPDKARYITRRLLDTTRRFLRNHEVLKPSTEPGFSVGIAACPTDGSGKQEWVRRLNNVLHRVRQNEDKQILSWSDVLDSTTTPVE